MPWWTAASCLTVALSCEGCRGTPEPAKAAPASEPSRHVVTGSVRYLTRYSLPPDAEVLVTLEDVSAADAPARVVAKQVIATRGRPTPIPFEVPYDPAKIDPSRLYAIRAQIRSGTGETLFASTTIDPVLTRGAPASTDLVLQPFGSASTGTGHPDLIETYWKIVSVGGENVVAGSNAQEAHLILKAKDHAVFGATGINRISGTYEQPDGPTSTWIVLHPGAMTRMAGPEPMMRQEERVLQCLRDVDGYRLAGDRLTLTARGHDVMVLRAVTER
jgi:putative lipoprotein